MTTVVRTESDVFVEMRRTAFVVSSMASYVLIRSLFGNIEFSDIEKDELILAHQKAIQ